MYFKTLCFFIPQDLIIESTRLLATIIFFSLKYSKDSISTNEYSIVLLKAKALLAGIVQGVVVQIIILASFKKGVGRIYNSLNLPCIPVALNSGKICKKSGKTSKSTPHSYQHMLGSTYIYIYIYICVERDMRECMGRA